MALLYRCLLHLQVLTRRLVDIACLWVHLRNVLCILLEKYKSGASFLLHLAEMRLNHRAVWWWTKLFNSVLLIVRAEMLLHPHLHLWRHQWWIEGARWYVGLEPPRFYLPEPVKSVD